MKKLILLAAIAVGALSACQKNNNPVPESSSNKLSASELDLLACGKGGPIKHGTDVYVVGTYHEPGIGWAAYWKNGTLVKLLPAISQGTAIAISGGNVYVAGGFQKPEGLHAAYWKNGVIHDLNGSDPHYQSFAYAMTVSGNDVYVVGDIIDITNHIWKPVVWKNGIPQILPAAVGVAGARAVAVGNGKVYVAGYENSGGTVLYWIDGVQGTLNASEGIGNVSDMALNGTDFYVSGSAGNVVAQTALYWKNGGPENVIQAQAYTSGIIIHNNDIYTVGSTYPTNSIPGDPRQAIYWKNGVATLFGAISSVSQGLDITFGGNDLYLLAQQPTGDPLNPAQLTYYKNGVAVANIANAEGIRIRVVQY